MSTMIQPQSCPFFLYDSFNKIINDQLHDIALDSGNGVALTFESSSDNQLQTVTVDIDSEGNVSKVSVIESETGAPEMIFDFGNDEFIHYGDSLDLICGHPLFHMLQQTTVAHYQADHYSVTVTAR